MSLPTTKSPAGQSSIRSFFTSKTPTYAPPPSQTPPPPRAAAESTPTAPVPSVDAPLPPAPSNLPSGAAVRPVVPDDIAALRRINSLLLPVSFQDVLYDRALDPALSGRFSRVVTWSQDGEPAKVVGGIICRVEPNVLYIQTLCLLSPYRGKGLIAAAVDHVVATAVADPKLNIESVTAHVWTENEEGLRWYQARGFERVGEPIQGYYIKLKPGSAWFVRREVGATVSNALPASPFSPSPFSASPTGPPRPVKPSATAAVVNLPGTASGSSTPPPPPRTSSASGQSFQKQRPDVEWNDLPQEMTPPALLNLKKSASSEPGSSNASSRSSSTARKKRDRSYPAAAFGN